MLGRFDDHGVRFRYPESWEVEADSDDSETSITLTAPDGLAFALLRLNDERPDPRETASEALAAIQAEYPALEATAVAETIDGQDALGFDAEFFSLDVVNGCVIRCFQTARRTILLFGQWTETDDEEPGDSIRSLARSIEETDGLAWPGGDGHPAAEDDD
jgi:hypothetical protein